MTFKLDTGVDCKAMSNNMFNALNVRGRLRASKTKLVAFFGQKVATLGKRVLTCEQGQKHKIEFEITKEDVPATLGGAICLKLGLVKRMHEVGKMHDILKDYDDLFDWLLTRSASYTD